MKDDLHDEEFPDPSDWDDEDDPDRDQATCPECGRWVYDEAEKCPHCGAWIVPTAGSSGRSRRLVAAVILMLALMVLLAVGWRWIGL